MKRIFILLLVIAGMLFIPNLFFAQTGSTSKPDAAFNNPIILSHYTISELQQVSPKKLAAINYYYTESFILDSISCTQCRAFNRTTFDVSQFEQFRKQSERYVRTYGKYGYKLTLLSKDEMQYESIR